MMSHPKHVLFSLKNELQKHCVLHQNHILLHAAMKPQYHDRVNGVVLYHMRCAGLNRVCAPTEKTL